MTTNEEIYSIISLTSELIDSDRLNDLDLLISYLDVGKMDPDQLLSWLTGTLAARNRLRNRPKLYADIQTKFVGVFGRRKASDVLGGLQ